MQTTQTSLLNKTHTIQEIRNLTNDTYILRLDRNGIEFKTGQYITIGLENSEELREYSVYSAEQDDFLEILVKELPDGYLSAILKHLNSEHSLVIKNPEGSMILRKEEICSHQYVFIASGTGIAPFHSFVRTYPNIDYTILHGVQYANEAYAHSDYKASRYILCTSKDDTGDFNGRVTDYLKQVQLGNNTLYYVCGNSNMVNEVLPILKNKGVAIENIRTEEYY